MDSSRYVVLGPILRFKKNFLEDVLQGRKTITIRWGILRIKYSDVIIVCENYAYGIASIEKVDYITLRDLPLEIIKSEGFKSKEEFIKVLKKLYPKINDKSYVTVINFKVKEVFKKPLPIQEALKMLGK